jgi:hypothetical protein
MAPGTSRMTTTLTMIAITPWTIAKKRKGMPLQTAAYNVRSAMRSET